MVMTAQTSPKLSRKGVILACTLALGGLVVTPLWACPSDEDQVKQEKRPKAPRASQPRPFTLVVPAAPRAPEPPKPPRAPEPPATTFEHFMHDRNGDSLERSIDQLERQIERLRQRLRELGSGRGRGVGVPGPRVQRFSVAPLAPLAPLAFAIIQPGPGLGAGACLRGAGACGNQVVTRSYELPEGKLSALTALMVRNDVPILVSPGDSRIEVQATEAQHCVFDAFVMMIGRDDLKTTYRLPEGQLEALTELMIRSDVPIFVEPGCEDIKVHGSELEQAVFAAFVKMIGPGGADPSASAPNADVYASELASLAERYEAQASAQVYEVQSLRAALSSLVEQSRRMEREADRAHDRAHKLADKADELEDDADELEDRAERRSGRERDKLMAKADSLRAKARELRVHFKALHEQAEAIAEQAEALEEEAEAIEEQIEGLAEEDRQDWEDEDDDDGSDDDDDD